MIQITNISPQKTNAAPTLSESIINQCVIHKQRPILPQNNWFLWGGKTTIPTLSQRRTRCGSVSDLHETERGRRKQKQVAWC